MTERFLERDDGLQLGLDVDGFGVEILEQREGLPVLLFFKVLDRILVEEGQWVLLGLLSGGQRASLRLEVAADRGQGNEDGEQGGLGQFIGAGLFDKHRLRGAFSSASGGM